MDSEFCEIDFTTATSWENFTAHLEEIFYSWKLYQSQAENSIDAAGDTFVCEFGTWLMKREIIEFDGNIKYYAILQRPFFTVVFFNNLSGFQVKHLNCCTIVE